MRLWCGARFLSPCGALLALWGCGPNVDVAAETKAIHEVVDAWHAAAARADESAYFSAFSEDAIFMGTDATERWDKAAFRAYAHPHFEKGKAWSFKATRRDVIIDPQGRLAWFDEDLATPNLGPARGSGVLRKGEGWLIAHYNLTITVPNERFKEVKALLDQPARAPQGEEERAPQGDKEGAQPDKSGNSDN